MNYFKKISLACALSLSSSSFAVTPSNTQTDAYKMSREEIIGQAIPTASLGIRLGQRPTPRTDAIAPSFMPFSHPQRLVQCMKTIVRQHPPEKRQSLIRDIVNFRNRHRHLQPLEKLLKTFQFIKSWQQNTAIQLPSTPISTRTPIRPLATDQEPVCWRIAPADHNYLDVLDEKENIIATKPVHTRTETGLRTILPSGRVRIYIQNGKYATLPRYSEDHADLVASGFAPSHVSPAVYVYKKSNPERDLDDMIRQTRINMEEKNTAAEALMGLNQNNQKHKSILKEEDIAFLTDDMDTSSDDLFESEPGQDSVTDLTSDMDIDSEYEYEPESDTDDELRICDESDDE